MRFYLLGVCLLLLQQAAPVMAIDAERTLSQALIRKWQVPQGLPQPRVLAIRQTVDGHLWLGTQIGLYLFDGLNFIPPPPELQSSLGTIWVQDLAEDAEHQLWIATIGEGLKCLSDGAVREYDTESGLPSMNVQKLLFDHRGTLWIATDAGVARMVNGKITPIPPQPGLTVRNARALCETASHTILIGGDHAQLNMYRDGQFLIRPLSTISPHVSIRALLATPDGKLHIGTSDGLIRLDEKGESKIGRAEGLGDDSIETLSSCGNGLIWVGTRDGVSRISETEIETIRTRDGLTQSTVCAICEDREKSVWVGTKNGLNQFVDRRTVPLTASEGLPSNETSAIVQDSGGNIFIGTLNAGLARYRGRRCDTVATKDSGLPGHRISTMISTGIEEFWVGTDEGLCRFEGKHVTQRFTTHHGLPDDNVLCLMNQASASRLWIGTAHGVAILEDDKVRPFAEQSELSQWAVRQIVEDTDNEVIVATDGGGLFRCHEGRAYSWLPEIPEVRNITSLFPVTGGGMWAGTRGEGLLLIRDQKVTRLTVLQGLYDDEIFGLAMDDIGQLWMACSRGIFFVKQQELLELAEGKRERILCTPFSPMEAQRTLECQQDVSPVICKMDDGRIWFSTIHGVIIIDPRAIFRELPPFPVWVERMLVNGKKVNPRQISSLPAGQTNLMFRYSGLSFAFPSRIEFRYKLEGFDKDWIEAGTRREAYYTNLPPGQYRFLVEAANPQNDWCRTPLPAEFIVEQYFYRTPWFYCLVGAAICLAIWGYLRFRVLQVRTRMNATLAERMRIARDLHDTLIQGFSGVTMQMQALSSRLKNPSERGVLDEVIQDAGDCLQEARRTVTGLRHAPESATGLIEDISRVARQLTETQSIHLRLRMPTEFPQFPSEVEYNLLRIVQEAMTNAVKHANAGLLIVSAKSNAQEIQLMIADDGDGFTQADGDPPTGHYGLIGMRERAHQIHATLRVESRPGRGTTVEVTMPRKAAAMIPSTGRYSADPHLTKEIPS